MEMKQPQPIYRKTKPFCCKCQHRHYRYANCHNPLAGFEPFIHHLTKSEIERRAQIEKKVHQLLAQGWIGVVEMAQALSISKATGQRWVIRLGDKGLLEERNVAIPHSRWHKEYRLRSEAKPGGTKANADPAFAAVSSIRGLTQLGRAVEP